MHVELCSLQWCTLFVRLGCCAFGWTFVFGSNKFSHDESPLAHNARHSTSRHAPDARLHSADASQFVYQGTFVAGKMHGNGQVEVPAVVGGRVGGAAAASARVAGSWEDGVFVASAPEEYVCISCLAFFIRGRRVFSFPTQQCLGKFFAKADAPGCAVRGCRRPCRPYFLPSNAGMYWPLSLCGASSYSLTLIVADGVATQTCCCLLYTSPSPRDRG